MAAQIEVDNLNFSQADILPFDVQERPALKKGCGCGCNGCAIRLRKLAFCAVILVVLAYAAFRILKK